MKLSGIIRTARPFLLLLILISAVLFFTVLANADTVTWTTKGDFENNRVLGPDCIKGTADDNTSGEATSRSKVNVSGVNPGDDASVNLPGPWVDYNKKTIAAGNSHTLGISTDGTVAAVGYDNKGQIELSGWTNIKSVACGVNYSLGLKTDGTVVATGENYYGQCNVSGWTNIKAIAAAETHSVGLKEDGTVVSVGRNSGGECNVSGWTNIKAIAAGGFSGNNKNWSLGLKDDGTVVAVGNNANGQCDVSGWTNIKAIAAGLGGHSLGIKEDGTVVGAGYNGYGQINVSGWTNIVAVGAGNIFSLGLKDDGTVVGLGYNGYGQIPTDWTNIKAIACGSSHSIGLKADGTCVGVGYNGQGGTNVSGWTNIRQPSYLFPSPGVISGFKMNAGTGFNDKWSTITWVNPDLPANTAIRFRTRGASTEADLATASWGAYYTSSGESINTSNSKWLEIGLSLESADGASTPTVDAFTITYYIPPLVVTGFIGTAESISSITWSWTDTTSEDGYSLHDGAHNVITSTAADVTTTLESGLSANTQYTRHVNAYNLGGSEESFSDSRFTLADIPTGLATVEITTSEVRLFWSGDGTRYAVERATQEAGPWAYKATWANNLVTTEYTDNAVSPNTNYWYRVHAYNGDQIMTDPGTAINTTTIAVPPPPAPQDFIGTAESTFSIRWSWSNVDGEDGYYLHDDAHAVKGTMGVDVTSTLESGLSANTQYSRHVKAYNGYGSNESSSDAKYTWAGVPTSLATLERTTSTIRIFWSGNGTRYAVERALQEAGPWAYIATWDNSVATTEYTDSSLNPGTIYCYRVHAYNGDQVMTDPGGTLSARTLYTLADVPTSLTTLETTTTTIRFFWSGNGVRYAVEKATQEAGPWTYIATWENNVATTEYTDSGLRSGKSFYYRVHAYNNDHVITNPSSILSAATPPAPSTYTTRVGSGVSWSWRIVQPGETVASGTPSAWQWKTWKSVAGQKVPSGEAHSWSWGDEKSTAQVTTTTITGITPNTGNGGGNVTDDGESDITARGVCWSTSHNPTTASSKTTDGSGKGSFTSFLTHLVLNTTYYVRAYATNSEGTAYGNEVGFTTSYISLTLGTSYEGGIIVYLDGTNKHGLIAARSDQSTGIQWGPSYLATSANGTARYTGQANTTKILNTYGAGSYAAKLCDDYVTVESSVPYDDWFLPSKDELNDIYTQKDWGRIGGFGTSYYWTSTENSAYGGLYYAWIQSMSGTQYDQAAKNTSYGVRAIRGF